MKNMCNEEKLWNKNVGQKKNYDYKIRLNNFFMKQIYGEENKNFGKKKS